MAVNGADILLLVNTGTEASPVFTPVGSQRDATFNETTEAIDGSNKTDGRMSRFEPGRYASTVDLESLYVPNDVAHGLLKQAMRLGLKIKVRRQFAGTPVEEAVAVVTNLSEADPDQDVATVSITLQIDGPWSAV